MTDANIVIIGGGAAGLMAARELARSGTSVVLLEAQDRIGGRIYPLEGHALGYPAEGGAEFVDGAAPYTRALAAEAGLSFVERSGEVWRFSDGSLAPEDEFDEYLARVQPKLAALEEDMPIAVFLRKYFGGSKHARLRATLTQTVEGYDAADPERASTFALRDDWLSHGFAQTKLEEGYGALVHFLKRECVAGGVAIHCNSDVKKVAWREGAVQLVCTNGQTFQATRAILTVPLPVIREISFDPPLPYKVGAIDRIGYGGVIKTLLKFADRWWVHADGKDLEELFLLFDEESDFSWWTQHPADHPVLTAWLSGVRAGRYAHCTDDEIVDAALASLSRVFGRSEEELYRMLQASRVFNWIEDPYARGGYSYATCQSSVAIEELRTPVAGVLYFAGEAVAGQGQWASVEAALASGAQTAHTILHRT